MPSTAREEVKSNNPPPTGRREGAHVIIDRNCCCCCGCCLAPQDKKFGIGLLLSDACAGDAAAGGTPERHAPAERLAREKTLPPEHDRSVVEAVVRKASILTGKWEMEWQKRKRQTERRHASGRQTDLPIPAGPSFFLILLIIIKRTNQARWQTRRPPSPARSHRPSSVRPRASRCP